MTQPAQAPVSRPLWWLAWAVFVGALALVVWLWATPLADISDLPGQTPVHDVAGR